MTASGFLSGGGEMGALIRVHDWGSSPLGQAETWPQSLRSALSICLNSSFPMAIYWGPELRLLYNDAWMPIPEERHPWALGRPAAEVWADIWEVLEPQFARVLQSGEGFSTYDQMLPLLRGGIRRETYWNYSFTPIRGEDGTVAGILNQGNETTARVLAERRGRFLLDLSDRLRSLSDPRAVIETAQAALGEHLGANRVGYGEVEETRRFFTTERNWTDGSVPTREGTHDLASFGPEILAALRAGIPLLIPDVERDPRTNSPESLAAFDAIDTRAVITASLVKASGLKAALYVHSRAARPWTEHDAELVAEVADRTWAAVERARAEERLRDLNETLERRVAERTAELAETDRRFRGLFDSALQFMALLTRDGTVIEVNRTALEWSRITADDIVGLPFWLAAPMRGNPALQNAIRDAARRAAAGETVREEHEMRGHGETRAIVDFSLKPVFSADGEATWLVAEGRDITELKHAQDALRQAQKLEAVGQLTGGVAHDFNNLLTIIRSSADLLRRSDLPDDRRRRYVEAVAETVDRAAKLTGQLLAFARRQALRPEVFDVAERMRDIADMLGTVAGARIRIVAEIACTECHVEADVSQFETALVNMAANARDAMDGEGTLTVQVERRRRAAGEFVAISLGDTGHGIPPDKLPQIFEPFFTTKEVGKGTGLGLSQVYGFAKQSGGDVVVESPPGQGATFTLLLPRAQRQETVEPPAPPAAETDPRDGGDGRRVLVVEDNLQVGEISTQILRDMGYETVWATDAQAALAFLSDQHRFDVVFSDVVMPGMSGIELGEEIRRRHPGLPVVLTSGYSDVLAEEGSHGFDLIHKPYAAAELSRILRRLTRRDPSA
ncbi:GAF domain-containing hybrid sensor histidine kinase/response regulator [Sabulicella glaciei]|uniref:histidine kinase n=1 Tax=Sabulicella glaciei TaxID=2984948 RepID=A0ABT3NQP4_9PROT|nr:ATP-binding protein [Roseococcus sp. MDT2-1-1]MCW8084203.1 PAS domain-containing protein [Roseococcus sp. MDT2-1-1]